MKNKIICGAAALLLPTIALADPPKISTRLPQQDPTTKCYQISNIGELYGFAALVEEGIDGAEKDPTACGVLTKDIVVNKNLLTASGDVNEENDFISWIPIHNFKGSFHGAGHTISGLYLNGNEYQKAGLFANIFGNVVIDSLGIVDSYFNNTHVGGTTGSFVGLMEEHSSLSMNECYNEANINSKAAAAGLVGEAYEYTNINMNGSHNSGNIISTSAGGLVGHTQGNLRVTNSYNTGNVYVTTGYVGGIASYVYDNAYIANSYNTGDITSQKGDAACIVGYIKKFAHLINVYSSGNLSAPNQHGAAKSFFNGFNVSVEIVNAFSAHVCPASEIDCDKPNATPEEIADGTIYKKFISSNYEGVDASVWKQGESDTHPTLSKGTAASLTLDTKGGELGYILNYYVPGITSPLPSATRKGYIFTGWSESEDASAAKFTTLDHKATGAKILYANWMEQKAPAVKNDCYQIGTVPELYAFATIVNEGLGDIERNMSACGELTDDIVINKNILDSANQLFGDGSNLVAWNPIGDARLISGVDSVMYSGTFNGHGHTVSGIYVNRTALEDAGLFGWVRNGAIDSVNVRDSYLRAFEYGGGIASRAEGTSRISNSSFIGEIDVGYHAGGIVGTAGKFDPEDEGITIANVYARGNIKGDSYTGGIVGVGLDTKIINAYVIADIKSSEKTGAYFGYSRYSETKNVFQASLCLTDSESECEDLKTSWKEFEDGTVAQLLHDFKDEENGVNGSIWGQILKQDPSPVFIGEIMEAPLAITKKILPSLIPSRIHVLDLKGRRVNKAANSGHYFTKFVK